MRCRIIDRIESILYTVVENVSLTELMIKQAKPEEKTYISEGCQYVQVSD
jgi:hypothetical protein